jgi:hypothetical protein
VELFIASSGRFVNKVVQLSIDGVKMCQDCRELSIGARVLGQGQIYLYFGFQSICLGA